MVLINGIAVSACKCGYEECLLFHNINEMTIRRRKCNKQTRNKKKNEKLLIAIQIDFPHSFPSFLHII